MILFTDGVQKPSSMFRKTCDPPEYRLVGKTRQTNRFRIQQGKFSGRPQTMLALHLASRYYHAHAVRKNHISCNSNSHLQNLSLAPPMKPLMISDDSAFEKNISSFIRFSERMEMSASSRGFSHRV